MKSLNEDYYNPFFSHIYIEKSVWEHPRTKAILARFPQAERIEIGHYKDVFGRSRQSYMRQHCAQKLILAKKQGSFIYEGAPVCQSFGNEYFYYTSCIRNCIFDCEYCYLKGMYSSGNIVIFVNLEDYFEEIEKVLNRHSMYLCVSYDTDLMAFEPVTGYTREWARFAGQHDNLKIEVRTKSANRKFWANEKAFPGMIYAFTLSPQAVIDAYEHQTPPLKARLDCAANALRAGFAVRLCFDPMIYFPRWQEHYEAMLRQVFDRIDMGKIEDVSVGSFRVSQDYLKRMRKNAPDSAVVQFPFQNDGGVYHYSGELTEQMEQFLTARLKKKIPEEKIFLWEQL